MKYTDILERESWRVMEDDSKEEKSARRVGSSVKGSRMRKPVPPPVVVIARVFTKDACEGVVCRGTV